MFWQNFKDWLAQPYHDEMDVVGWFLFLGLLAIITVIWGMIFSHIKFGD